MPLGNKGPLVLLSGDNRVFRRLPASKFYLSSSRHFRVLCLAADRKHRKSVFYELSGKEISKLVVVVGFFFSPTTVVVLKFPRSLNRLLSEKEEAEMWTKRGLAKSKGWIGAAYLPESGMT